VERRLIFLNHSSAARRKMIYGQVKGVIAEYERAEALERGRRGRRHAASPDRSVR